MVSVRINFLPYYSNIGWVAFLKAVIESDDLRPSTRERGNVLKEQVRHLLWMSVSLIDCLTHRQET